MLRVATFQSIHTKVAVRKDFYELIHSSGVAPKKILHVGANSGQEARMYDQLGIEAWHVEAIPGVYNQLVETCGHLRNQRAICACLSSREGEEVKFNIASNSGLSSSFLELGRHKYAHPEVSYTSKIILETKTIDGLMRNGEIPSDIDFLVLDVQGAEQTILEGAHTFLARRHLIGCQIETSVVPLYANGSTYLEIGNLLLAHDLYLKQVEFNQMGWSDALYCKPYWPEPLGNDDWHLIEVLRPKPSPTPLIRIGGETDGAYLLPKDFEGIKACYSPGVNNRKDFEDELLEVFGIESHMCDFTSDASQFKTPLKPRQTFRKKWLDINKSPDSISLEEWVEQLTPDKSDDLILQMDIEGAEYRNLLGTNDDVLLRFRIIILELHGLTACNSTNLFRKELGPLLARLDEHFLCVHAHPNNCSDEFDINESKYNMSNILEVTFLRRDRWDGVDQQNCHPPMLPHPEDIKYNVSDLPPIFLNSEWLKAGERAPASTIKLLTDKLKYLERMSTFNSAATESLYRMAIHATSLLNSSIGSSTSLPLFEIAAGKQYQLSSSYGATQASGHIEDREPFFFHTGLGMNQSITIDLGCLYALFKLTVANRTNICQDRAMFLCYCVHDSDVPNLSLGLPIATSKEFFQVPPTKLETKLHGVVGRYFTLFSPAHTMLHLSSIQIYGIPASEQSSRMSNN